MSYFGCSTKSNKVAWVLFAVLAVLGVVFMVVFISRFFVCYDDYDDCMTHLLIDGKITSEEYKLYHRRRGEIYWDDDDISKTENAFVNECEEELEECDEIVLAFFAVMVACYVAASIPLYFMCCCSQRPSFPDGNFAVVELPSQALTARVVNLMSFKRGDDAKVAKVVRDNSKEKFENEQEEYLNGGVSTLHVTPVEPES